MLRKAIIIIGVTVFTGILLVATTLRVNGGFETFSDVSTQSINSAVREHAGLASDAYIYAQPLLRSFAIMYQDIAVKSAADSIGAFNTLKVVARVSGESDQSIHIKAWLDLRSEPQLLHVPRGGGFLGGMTLLDLYGETAYRIKSGDEDANYLIVERDWNGEMPLGIHRVIRSNTDLLQVHSRSRVASAATHERLKSWAHTVALVPLSAYTMEMTPQRAPALKFPEWSEELATTTQFIPYLNFMLRFLHPDADEAALLSRFQKIGVVAGLPRAPTRYSGAIAAGIAEAREKLAEMGEDSGELLNLEEEQTRVQARDSVATIGQI